MKIAEGKSLQGWTEKQEFPRVLEGFTFSVQVKRKPGLDVWQQINGSASRGWWYTVIN